MIADHRLTALVLRSAESTRAKADEILSRPEFAGAQPNLFQRITKAFGRLIGAAFNGLVEGGINAVAAWTILIGIIGLVVWVALRVTRASRAEARRGVAVAVEGPHLTPVEWRTRAEEYEVRGEWKEALRCRYRGLVSELIARRVVRDLPGRTTGEYRAEVAASAPPAAAAFGAATDLFERAWYGHRPTGADECARFAARADEVLALARRGSRSPGGSPVAASAGNPSARP